MGKQKVMSLFFLAVGIYGLLFSRQIPLGKWTEPGPGVFPLTLSVLLCLSGILGFLLGKRAAQTEERLAWREILGAKGLPLRIAVLTAAFIPLMGVAGYLTAAVLYLFSLLFWVSRYSLRASLAYAIVLGAVSWYGFTRFLAIDLPKMGVWFL
jgi:putative tricarboxylic transport membrane protein